MQYYAISIFISAFLLFQIQPMISKFILPWFGGAPAVWSTSQLFFQVLLTGGYAYAYWLIGKLKARNQGIIHLSMLVLSLGFLAANVIIWQSPITPNISWRPDSVNNPILHVIRILAMAVGIPFFLLATNSTLMQSWFIRDYPNKNPYRFYALSNFGSLLALISYPFLVEPNLILQLQAKLWSGGYVIFALLAAFGAAKSFTRKPAVVPKADAYTENPPTPTLFVRILWVLLPACASLLLLAITNHVTQEIAAIPFLWILPLTIYLLSFILTFDNERWYSRLWYSLGLLISSGFTFWSILEHPHLEYLEEFFGEEKNTIVKNA